MDICVIPARMGSSRFPGKPLKNILGLPMVGHVVERCRIEKIFEEVIVATCDQEIMRFCSDRGYQYVMTSPTHERASDRVQEAAVKLEAHLGKKFSSVTMVQGDEPMVTPQMLKMALLGLTLNKAKVVNLRAEIKDEDEFSSPNCVKVVVDLNDYALYFSRSRIPNTAKFEGRPKAFKQICVIPFERDFLDTYSALEPTDLEIVESVDMNRVLQHGYKLFCPEIFEQSFPVDVPLDLIKVEGHLKDDPLVSRYL